MNPSDPFGLSGLVLDGQYRVEKVVGEGGFSAVYRGHNVGLNEPIAIKCLKLPPALSTELVDTFFQRFRDESRILYRLSQGNLNIMRSIGSGSVQAPATGMLVPYMILEWLEGRSMAAEFVARRQQGSTGRSLDEVINLFDSAADALAFAHGQGVIHRDLNPGNLFLAQTQQGIKMKVLDFGVAKLMDDSLGLGPRQQTMGQIRIFAPAYGSPEQFDDALGTVGAASDVYSFALILLEALRDRSINEGAHLGEFAQFAIDPNRRPTPRTFGVNVSDEVEATFVRATKLNPKERWQSASDFWKSLTISARLSGAAGVAMTQPGGHARTLPLGSPALPPGLGAPLPPARPKSAPGFQAVRPPSSPPRPNAPASQRMPVAVPRPPSNPPGKVVGTQKFGSVPQMAARPVTQAMPSPALPEQEDEVTRVRSPDADILKTLASDKRPAMPTPIPAAGMPYPDEAPISEPPPSPGTLIMAPTDNPNAPKPQGAPQGTTPIAIPPQAQTGGQPKRPPAALTGTQMGVAYTPPPTTPGQGVSGTGKLPSQGHIRHATQVGGFAAQPQAQIPQAQPKAPPPAMHTPTPATPMAPMPLPPQQQMQQPPPQQQQMQQPQMQPPMQQPMQQQQQQQMPPQAMQQPGLIATRPGQPSPFAGQRPPQPFVATPSEVPSPPTNKTPIFIGVGVFAVLFVLGGVLGTVAILRGKSTTTIPTVSSSVALPVPVPMPTESTTTAATDTTTPAPPETATAPTAEVDAAPPPTEPEPTATNTAATANPTATTTAWAPTTATTAAPSAKPSATPVDPNAFDRAAAQRATAGAAGMSAFCKSKDGTGMSGPGSASVTFGNDGSATSVVMAPPYSGTNEGNCVAGQLKRAKTKPFEGAPQTIQQTFDVPK